MTCLVLYFLCPCYLADRYLPSEHEIHTLLFFFIKIDVKEPTRSHLESRGQFYNREEIYRILEGSAIFLQKPGDHVVSGTLRWSFTMDGIPSWMETKMNYPKVILREPVFFYNPGLNIAFLRADLGNHIHKKDDPNVQGYKCFVKIADAEIYEADLSQHPEEIKWPVRTTVYIRVPEKNLIYAGELKPIARQNAPIWVSLMKVQKLLFKK